MKSVLTLILCAISILTQAQIYDFPIKPGSEEWGKLVTEQDRFEATQIPESILNSMSTSDLIKTCMNHPARIYFTAFDDPQDGMDIIINNFNGLKGLLNRADAANVLLSMYKQMDENEMSIQGKRFDRSSWMIERNFFELLLAQDSIINQMDESECYELIEEVYKKVNSKLELEEDNSLIDYQPSFLIIRKLFNKSATNRNQDLKTKIEQLFNQEALNFLSERTVDLSQVGFEYGTYASGTIYTPNGTGVSILRLIDDELTQEKKEALKTYWLDYYDNRITYVDEATRKYNCYAYAWYMSDGHENDPVVMYYPETYWFDGSYVEGTSYSDASVVYFPSDYHAALVMTSSGLLKSKWGPSPLFIHSRQDCPYPNSTTLKYYRKATNYDTTPSKPTAVSFTNEGNGVFSASVTNDSRYNVDQYEWRTDYPSDWSISGQNAMRSSVRIYGSSSPRSTNLYARAHNSYGWGEWQTIGWLYASSSYSLSVDQNPVSTTLQVRIQPMLETAAQADKATADKLTNQTYSIGLYSSTGTRVYQSTIPNNGNGLVSVSIDVSSLPNGIYILHVRNTKANEAPQTLNIVVRH